MASDEDILKTGKERFECAETFFEEPYKRGQDDVDFVMGDQWPEDIKNQRAKDGRPCLSENRTLVFANQVVNAFRQARPAINVIPVDSQSDVVTAKIIKGLVRNIETQSTADTIYDTAVWNAVTASIGWARVNTKYCGEDTFDQEIELIRVPDFSSVLIDPNSKTLDGSDAEYGFVFEDMDREEFKRKYPNANEVPFKESSDKWAKENTVRVAEYFYREYTEKTLALTADGPVFEEDVGDREILQKRTVRIPAVKYCKLTSEEVLEKTDWLGSYIPLVPFYGLEVWQEDRRQFYSLVHQARDPQTRFNFWLTASTEIIALQPKAPFIGLTGQFATHARKWARANNENFPFLEYDSVKIDDIGTIAPPPQRQPPPQGSQAMFNEMMAAADGIKAVVGMFDASIGNIGNETSGKAIQARAEGADNATFHFADNAQHSIRQIGRIIIDLIPKVYTGQRVLRILGDEDSRLNVPVNQPVVQAQDGFRPAQAGEKSQAYFKLDSGKYDVVATVGSSFATKRMETVDTLKSVIQAIPETFNTFGDILFKNMDIPDSEVMAERLKKMNPAMNDEAHPLQVQLDQATQVIQQLQQQITNQQAALVDKGEKEKADIQIKMGELELKNKELEIKAAETVAKINKMQAETTGLNQDAIQEVLRTIAALEDGLRDTATAVEMILDNEGRKATSQPVNAIEEGMIDE